MIELSQKEISKQIDGAVNLQAIFKENVAIKAQFLATKPLELALAAHNLEAVKILVANGETYANWPDIVDNGTPLYEFMAATFKKDNASDSRPSNKCKL